MSRPRASTHGAAPPKYQEPRKAAPIRNGVDGVFVGVTCVNAAQNFVELAALVVETGASSDPEVHSVGAPTNDDHQRESCDRRHARRWSLESQRHNLAHLSATRNWNGASGPVRTDLERLLGKEDVRLTMR